MSWLFPQPAERENWLSRLMHLVISGSDLGRQRGGNESYLMGLLAGLGDLGRSADLDVSVVVAEPGTRLLESDARWQSFGVTDVGPYRRVPFLLWQLSAALLKLRPDWVLGTYFLPPFIPCRAAVLIHDLSFRAHPEYFPKPIAVYMRLLTSLAIRRADLVVALSEFTLQEIQRFYPGAEDRTVVIYPGVASTFSPGGDPVADQRTLAALDVHPPYLLAVGSIHYRKNLDRLLTAWKRLQIAGLPVAPMVWAGLGRWGVSELLDRAEAEGVRLLSHVADDQLATLYRNAVALAYPSLYEGFGLPPLEAMASGTPVLAANTTAIPEAVGTTAVTVDPTDIDSLTQGLRQILFDEELRQELRLRGPARASTFQWRRTAEQLVCALKKNSEDRDP